MPKRDSGADSSEAKLDFARKKSLLQNVIDSARKIGQNGINKKSDTFDQEVILEKRSPIYYQGMQARCNRSIGIEILSIKGEASSFSASMAHKRDNYSEIQTK